MSPLNHGIFIEKLAGGVRAAVIQRNELISLHYDADDPSYHALDNIYYGKVIAKSDAGYFVNIGSNKPALLPSEKGFPKLRVGDSVHAQVIREPQIDFAESSHIKPSKLSQHLTMTGRYVRITPSKHIPAKLSLQARELGIALDELPHGTLVREAAGDVGHSEIVTEIALLSQQLDKILTIKPNKSSNVYTSPNSFERLVRDTKLGDDIVVNEPELAAHLKQYTDLNIHIEKGNLFIDTGIDDAWGELFTNVLPLPSGGNIAIENTAIGCMIDVNQGNGKIHDANREAAIRIAEQIKLRGIGGNIAIDFIDVTSINSKKDMQTRLLRALDNYDSIRVLGWAPTGWLLLRCNRRRMPITDKLSDICQSCQGIGRNFYE